MICLSSVRGWFLRPTLRGTSLHLRHGTTNSSTMQPPTILHLLWLVKLQKRFERLD